MELAVPVLLVTTNRILAGCIKNIYDNSIKRYLKLADLDIIELL